MTGSLGAKAGMAAEPARGVLPGGCMAVIAVKQRSHGKSHLAECLSLAERVGLIRTMLDRVIEASEGAALLSGAMVVSPERDTVAARIPVLEDAGAGMNEAFDLARVALRLQGVRMMAALPADLPGLRASDLDALVRAAGEGGVAIAPDGRGTGTNALVCPVALPMTFRFGPDSCRRHAEEARLLGIEPALVKRPGLSFDVDLPADLQCLEPPSPAPPSSGNGGRAQESVPVPVRCP